LSALFITLGVFAFPQDLTQKLLIGLWLSLFGASCLFSLYWTLTPVPLLVVDQTGLIFQRWPFYLRTIEWTEVSDVVATKRLCEKW
jgi:hypothetical protein